MKNLSISEDDINDDTIDEASEIVGIAYGNLIVFNRNWIHLSIGPDCISIQN